MGLRKSREKSLDLDLETQVIVQYVLRNILFTPPFSIVAPTSQKPPQLLDQDLFAMTAPSLMTTSAPVRGAPLLMSHRDQIGMIYQPPFVSNFGPFRLRMAVGSNHIPGERLEAS